MSEYVGFDVSKEETAFCVKDKDGKVLARGKVATDPQALFEVLYQFAIYRLSAIHGKAVMDRTVSGFPRSGGRLRRFCDGIHGFEDDVGEELLAPSHMFSTGLSCGEYGGRVRTVMVSGMLRAPGL